MGSDLFSIGQSGLFASKKSLQTTSHNIANVNTEGYSRQRVEQATYAPVGSGNQIYGTGTYVRQVARVQDGYAERKLRTTLSEHHYDLERQYQLNIVEGVINELNYEGLNQKMANFFNSFRNLSNNPNSDTARSVVVETSKHLIDHFRSMRTSIDEAARGINVRLQEAVTDCNSLLDSISRVNYRIRELEGAEGEANDLKDERDLYLKKLSELFTVQVYTDGKGKSVVNAQGVGTLVSGGINQSFSLGSRPPAADNIGQNFPGAAEIFHGKKFISEKLQLGKIGALLETRNIELKELQEKVDEIAFHFLNTVNAVHRKGFVDGEIAVDALGQPLPNHLQKRPVTNIDFFKPESEQMGAAGRIALSDEITQSLANIATALEPNKPGDNRIALGIAAIQHSPLMAEGQRTLEDDYLQHVGTLGMKINKARLNSEQSEGMLALSQSIRERYAGVSLDEEMSNMVKFQQAYNASAKMLKVADDVIMEVLNLKR